MGFGQYAKVDDVQREAGYPVPRTKVEYGRMTKPEIMAEVSDHDYIDAKFSAHNEITIRYKDGALVCRFRETNVVEIDGNNVVVIDTGGWNTISTRRHVIDFLKRHGFKISMWGDKRRGGNVLILPYSHENERQEIPFKKQIMFNQEGGVVSDLGNESIFMMRGEMRRLGQ